MTNVTIPLELFDDLIVNTESCLNKAMNDGDEGLADIYQEELDKCEKIIKELSVDC